MPNQVFCLHLAQPKCFLHSYIMLFTASTIGLTSALTSFLVQSVLESHIGHAILCYLLTDSCPSCDAGVGTSSIGHFLWDASSSSIAEYCAWSPRPHGVDWLLVVATASLYVSCHVLLHKAHRGSPAAVFQMSTALLLVWMAFAVVSGRIHMPGDATFPCTFEYMDMGDSKPTDVSLNCTDVPFPNLMTSAAQCTTLLTTAAATLVSLFVVREAARTHTPALCCSETPKM